MADPNRQHLTEVMELLSQLDQALEEIELGEEHRDRVLSQIAATKGREFVTSLFDSPPGVEALQDVGPESVPSQGARGDSTNPSPKVAVYQSIIEEHGRPMHVTEIARAALNLGVSLGGSEQKDPAAKVRSSLFESKRFWGSEQKDPAAKVRSSLFESKRFCNTGDNYWWVAGRTLPEEQCSQTLPLLTDARSEPDPPLLK